MHLTTLLNLLILNYSCNCMLKDTLNYQLDFSVQTWNSIKK